MKKNLVLLVLLFVAMFANAQIITGFTQAGEVAILSNGMRVNITQYPGWNHFTDRLTIQENINRHFQNLYRDNPDEYYLEARAYGFTGNVMGVGNGMMGVGMYGTGMNNSGMVYGAGGMAGATSTVQVTNQNMMATTGSGLNMYYDTASNSMSISGDPLMAAGRLINFIGGSKKSKKTNGYTNGQVLQDAQGNKYVVNNGVLVPQTQQHVTRSAQPVQQVRSNTTVQQNQNTQYEIVFDSASGTYVKVPVR